MQPILPPIPLSFPGDVSPTVSVVMPCLDEAKTVGRCVDKALACLRDMGVRGEVIVADNGSTDGSQDTARTRGARVVLVERRGYGHAVRGGVAAARGTFVIMGDADDSYDFGALAPFVHRLEQGDELVVGNRFLGGILPGAMPWLHRYVGNPLLSGMLNAFYRTPVGDAHCGMRAFRKDAYDRLRLVAGGMEFASEMVVKASLQRQRISQVPVVLHPDGRGRRPHLRSFCDGWLHLRFLLLFSPRWLYFLPGTVLLGSGLVLLAWLTPGPRQMQGVTFDIHTMLLGVLWVMLGYQILWTWAFANVYGRMSGVLPGATSSPRIVRSLTLERGLLIGAGLFVAGLLLNAWLAWQWWGVHLGPLDVHVTFRYALWGFLVMTLGMQTIFGSFFLSMLGMSDALRGKDSLLP